MVDLSIILANIYHIVIISLAKYIIIMEGAR